MRYTFNTRILTTQEQNLSTDGRDVCAIIFALSQYEFIKLGSKFRITIFTVIIFYLFLFTRKGNRTPSM